MSRPAVRAGVIIGLILVVYAGAGRATFVFDDRPLILRNPRVLHAEPLWRYWADSHLIGGHELRGFRPLTMASFAWNYRIAGHSRAVFHFTSVSLHILTALGLWQLILILLRQRTQDESAAESAALLGACLFAVHPALSQAVLFLTARSTLIAAAGSLWAAVAYARCLEAEATSSGRHRLWYVLAVCAWIIALSGRENAIAAGILFAGLEWLAAKRWKDRWQPVRALRRLGPLVLLGLLYLVWVFVGVRAQSTTPPARDWSAHLVGQSAAAWEYTRLLVWPAHLALDHGAEHLADAWSMQASLGLVIVLALLTTAWLCRRRQPMVAYGLLTALVVIGPESYAIPLKILVSEHRLYFPTACLIVALCGGIAMLDARWRTLLRACGLTCIALAAAGTVQRVRVWRTPETLWADAWTKYPTSCRAPAHLGQLALEAGQPVDAIGFLEAATECNPVRLEPRLLLAQAYDNTGRHDDGYEVAASAVRDFPASAEAHVSAGTARAQGGRVAEAVTHWRRALALDPENIAARANLDRAAAQGFDTRGNVR